MSENHWTEAISVEHRPIGSWACYSSSRESAITCGRVLTSHRAIKEMGLGVEFVKFWSKDE